MPGGGPLDGQGDSVMGTETPPNPIATPRRIIYNRSPSRGKASAVSSRGHRWRSSVGRAADV